ncbi:uncharacterized protein [Temnothorax longispinosus]|uniref:uncharacterized protein n=1 Tax=Temnothorax longispinosus TaxID=300112 RepID=UPI003A99E275
MGSIMGDVSFSFENYNGFIAKCVHGNKHLSQEIVNNLVIAQGVLILKSRAMERERNANNVMYINQLRSSNMRESVNVSITPFFTLKVIHLIEDLVALMRQTPIQSQVSKRSSLREFFWPRHPCVCSMTAESLSNSRDGRFAAELLFLVVPRITETLPAQTINRCDLNLPQNITLADPEFCTPSEIDALIGAELFYRLLCVGQIKLGNALIIQKTRLGWIASGAIHDRGPASNRIACDLVVDSLDAQVAKFWKIEEVSSVRPKKRLYSLEGRLAQDPQLREEYTDFLDEYERLGHMTEIPVSDVTEEVYFIPHHSVFKRDSHTTKLRVVFNALSKSSTGVSLNDVLLAGPTLQEDLFSIVTRFRTHRYVLSADIEKMYRQVKVHPEDGKYQIIVWRRSPKDPIKIYILNTATYGTVPASFLVVRSLLQLSEDERGRFPLARRVLFEDFCMDDALTGALKLDQARRLRDELIGLLACGGFHLRKWCSNEPSLLEPLLDKSLDPHICLSESETQKTLGIH